MGGLTIPSAEKFIEQSEAQIDKFINENLIRPSTEIILIIDMFKKLSRIQIETFAMMLNPSTPTEALVQRVKEEVIGNGSTEKNNNSRR